MKGVTAIILKETPDEKDLPRMERREQETDSLGGRATENECRFQMRRQTCERRGEWQEAACCLSEITGKGKIMSCMKQINSLFCMCVRIRSII